jgi:hypothetical protein
MKRTAVTARTAALLISLSSSFVIAAQTSTVKPVPSPSPLDSISADKSSPSEDRSPLTTFEEELRAKRAIKLAEKEHQENLNRANEISQLGKELKDAVKSRPILDRDNVKRVDRLEKLTKKIRGEAGGEDDEVKIIDRPSDIPAAVSQIAAAAELLAKDVQNTPRQVVSAAVIDRANVLLELVRILRGLSH